MQYGRSSMGGLTQRRAQAPVQTPAHSQRQRGVALVVVLLFLVAITGISVWTVRQSMLAEGMARNQMDQEVARQAAESALRDAAARAHDQGADMVWISHAGVARCVQWLQQHGPGRAPQAHEWPLQAPDFGAWVSVALPTQGWA